MFLAVVRRQFEDQRPVAQRGLSGQVHSPLDPPAQLGQEEEVPQGFPDGREPGRRRRNLAGRQGLSGRALRRPVRRWPPRGLAPLPEMYGGGGELFGRTSHNVSRETAPEGSQTVTSGVPE